jgi:hypothetical protein
MSVLNKIFPVSKSAGKIVDSITKGVDESILTKEEKANYLLKWLDASLPHNTTMRVLAWSVGGVWIISYLAMQIAGMSGYDAQYQLLKDGLTQFVEPHFDTIVYAYFGVAVLSRIKGK